MDEDVELLSPFKSPSVNDLSSSSQRRRRGSGSSASSTGKDVVSPQTNNTRLNNFYGSTATAPHSREESEEGRDENDPPVGCSSSGGGDSSRINPFEKDVLAGLQTSFWSPSILEISDTPPQRSWAIEHLSQLFPKDIENSPSTHQNSFPVDDQMEAKAQADIDVYFSRGQIVPTPSPMKQQVFKVHGEITRLKSTSTDVHYGQSPIARGGIGLNGGNIKKLKKPVSVIDRWTQTAISLPVNLPQYVETMLYQYSQDTQFCGSSGEAIIHCSQKSEASDHAETGDTNDSGKNSSSLNNSIRRRLELSFGEDADGEESSQGLSQGPATSPITDPFRRNHVVSTPPNASSSHLFQLNTTTSDLEVQLMRCEFTPESRGGAGGISFSTTPGITPIHDEQQEELKSMYHHRTSSTPRRNNNTVSKRWLNKDQFLPSSSPMEEAVSSSASSSSSSAKNSGNDNVSHQQSNNNVLRRSRTDNNERAHNKKRSSAASFDDSQILMDDSSPPAKVCRRNSKNDDDEISDS